jgi:hypothetical protein
MDERALLEEPPFDEARVLVLLRPLEALPRPLEGPPRPPEELDPLRPAVELEPRLPPARDAPWPEPFPELLRDPDRLGVELEPLPERPLLLRPLPELLPPRDPPREELEEERSAMI